MFRVTKAEQGPHTTIAIDGELSGDHIEVVAVCCQQAIAAGKPVDLFLRDVSAVDQAGRALLRRLAAQGVRLIGSGVYTAYLVRALDPASVEPLNSVRAGAPVRRVP
jgi:ABC-type transporter Mla MlaB component